MEIHDITEIRAAFLLTDNGAEYITAKSEDHQYTLRKEWKHDFHFVQVVKFIRRHGYVRKFAGASYTYFNINGYKYWTMGADIDRNGKPHTILINRAEVEYESDYDGNADVYDKIFTDTKSVIQDVKLFALLQLGGSILDIGCGTGLLLDHVEHCNYTGIDTSKDMIDLFKKKHAHYRNNVMTCSINDYITDEKYTNIVALYGTASYLSPEDIQKLTTMLEAGGRLILMYYAWDYIPITHKLLDIDPAITRKDAGYKFDQNYRIITLQN